MYVCMYLYKYMYMAAVIGHIEAHVEMGFISCELVPTQTPRIDT